MKDFETVSVSKHLIFETPLTAGSKKAAVSLKKIREKSWHVFCFHIDRASFGVMEVIHLKVNKKGVRRMEIKSCCVIGGRRMGRQIALNSAI